MKLEEKVGQCIECGFIEPRTNFEAESDRWVCGVPKNRLMKYLEETGVKWTREGLRLVGLRFADKLMKKPRRLGKTCFAVRPDSDSFPFVQPEEDREADEKLRREKPRGHRLAVCEAGQKSGHRLCIGCSQGSNSVLEPWGGGLGSDARQGGAPMR